MSPIEIAVATAADLAVTQSVLACALDAEAVLKIPARNSERQEARNLFFLFRLTTITTSNKVSAHWLPHRLYPIFTKEGHNELNQEAA